MSSVIRKPGTWLVSSDTKDATGFSHSAYVSIKGHLIVNYTCKTQQSQHLVIWYVEYIYVYLCVYSYQLVGNYICLYCCLLLVVNVSQATQFHSTVHLYSMRPQNDNKVNLEPLNLNQQSVCNTDFQKHVLMTARPSVIKITFIHVCRELSQGVIQRTWMLRSFQTLAETLI